MSSHREAPEISKDPVADSTDVYAFVSPDKPDTVTIIANYIPFEEPAGGPNFYEFGEDVLYEINIDNSGDGQADISYQFRFQTQLQDPNTFLYNTGPITSLDSPNWNSRQCYSVTRVDAEDATALAFSMYLSLLYSKLPWMIPSSTTVSTACRTSFSGAETSVEKPRPKSACFLRPRAARGLIVEARQNNKSKARVSPQPWAGKPVPAGMYSLASTEFSIPVLLSIFSMHFNCWPKSWIFLQSILT